MHSHGDAIKKGSTNNAITIDNARPKALAYTHIYMYGSLHPMSEIITD
jgi:hypothetical protein